MEYTQCNPNTPGGAERRQGKFLTDNLDCSYKTLYRKSDLEFHLSFNSLATVTPVGLRVGKDFPGTQRGIPGGRGRNI